MTTIAWDGKTLATDRQGNSSGMRVRTTKLMRLENGQHAAWAGTHECGLMLAAWYVRGADPELWPDFQKTDEWTKFIVLIDRQIIVYERHPFPQALEDEFGAWGSGREYAIGAMAAGKTARQAVEIASRFDVDSGMGVISVNARGPHGEVVYA